MDKAAEMGPLVSAAHKAKVEGYIETGIKEGAKLVVDGRGVKVQGHENGFFTGGRSEEHTSELQSLMRNSYAVFCLKKTTNTTTTANNKQKTTKHNTQPQKEQITDTQKL